MVLLSPTNYGVDQDMQYACLGRGSMHILNLKGFTMKTIYTILALTALQAMVFAGPTLDLSTAGASGAINGAIFQQINAQSTGTGVIDAFLRIQKTGAEEGYNTDYRPTSYDENPSIQFTRSLLLASIPTVNINGTLYREFLLDINESSTKSELSLDRLQIYQANAGNLHGTLAQLQTSWTQIYDLDAGEDSWIKLDYDLNHGSGSGDMFAYIPDALFKAEYGPYVYLYSLFGETIAADSGFEEWSVRVIQDDTILTPPPAVPAPGALLLASMGMTLVGYLRRGGKL